MWDGEFRGGRRGTRVCLLRGWKTGGDVEDGDNFRKLERKGWRAMMVLLSLHDTQDRAESSWHEGKAVCYA